MARTPQWRITGDWFDNCSCSVACPCTYAEPPDDDFCESVLFWHLAEFAITSDSKVRQEKGRQEAFEVRGDCRRAER